VKRHCVNIRCDSVNWYPRINPRATARGHFLGSTSTDPRGAVGQFGAQLCKVGGVCRSSGAHHQVDSRERCEQLAPQDLPYAAPQTIAGHRGFSEAGNDDPRPRVALRVWTPSHLEVTHAHPAPGFPALYEISPAWQPCARRVPLARQPLQCFDGSCTVRRLRPFLRRRASVARPHLSFMRARKPCLLMRRRLRGRYVGFPILPSSKAGKPISGGEVVQG